METIITANISEGTTEPHFPEVQTEWFDNSKDDNSTITAAATDMAFMLKRQHEQPRPTWTSFNQKHSQINPEQSIVGYLPIIQAPAHDIDTLNTVVQRILHITASFQQQHAVPTVDQALFPALMELKWANPQYKDVLIPRLGGLQCFYELFENPGSAHTGFWFGGGLDREWIHGAEFYGESVGW